MIECDGSATTRSGTAYTNTYCLVLECRNGKVVKWTEYADTEKIRMLCKGS